MLFGGDLSKISFAVDNFGRMKVGASERLIKIIKKNNIILIIVLIRKN